MPNTKTQNAKQLNDIVNYIIKTFNELIEEHKSQDGNKRNKSKNINCWDLKIDNIPVRFQLDCDLYANCRSDEYALYLERTFEWNGKIFLEEGLGDFNREKTEIKVEEDKIDELKTILQIINMFNFDNLKFCKIKNRFVEKDDIFVKAINCFDLNCQDADECCVCYDKTTVKTKCNHTLCLECISKMKKFIPQTSRNYINCPMCKQKVDDFVTNSNDMCEYVSDEEEDEDDE